MVTEATADAMSSCGGPTLSSMSSGRWSRRQSDTCQAGDALAHGLECEPQRARLKHAMATPSAVLGMHQCSADLQSKHVTVIATSSGAFGMHQDQQPAVHAELHLPDGDVNGLDLCRLPVRTQLARAEPAGVAVAHLDDRQPLQAHSSGSLNRALLSGGSRCAAAEAGLHADMRFASP